MNKGFTVWLTGLPGAGKATISHLLEKRLKENYGINPEVLTSELIRTNLSPEMEYNKLDQDVIIHCAMFLCKVLARNGIAVISTVTSPQRASREKARIEIDNFVEIYVKCPLELSAIRDVEGIHLKALNGEILEFIGKSDPYEEPLNPDLVVETDKETAEASADKIIKKLSDLNYIIEK
ncbi:MAG: adenylyl-sulfate kinase [Candidatus Kuenenia sp.]|nr:adenylyl-sulfate kinase [Candidatus Kuenenia hertensis]